MAKTCKYQKYRKYVSFDNGQTWSPLDEYRDGELIEYDSPDCGGGTTEYRWVTVNQYCEDTDLYAHQKKQVSYDGGQTWEDTNPLVTQEVLIETGSTECQPVPPTPIPQYKWVVVNEYCDGLDLYEHQKQQVSYDSGSTWQDTNPLVTQEVLIEAGSASCEPTPPPPTIYKVVKHYGTGETSSVQCNSNSGLTDSEVRGGGTYSAMTDAEIGTCVQEIAFGAFSGCTSLTSVTIPDSVTYIGHNVFANCRRLSSITIPDSVTSIGSEAFYGCSAMTTCNIGSGVTNIGDGAFYNCYSLSSITIPDSLVLIASSVFAGCRSLSSVTIPDSLTGIRDYAFSNCTAMTTCNIGSGVTFIGNGAFHGCYSLSSITIPDRVTNIGHSVFRGCSAMTSCHIGGGIVEITNSIFSGCTSLSSITIPSNVTNIGDYAFRYCSGLTSITVNATTPPTLGSHAFDGSSCPIIVPCESLNAYQTASGWINYASRIICNATPQYRWTTARTYCNGTDLYAHKVEQVSYDGGETWTDTGVTDEELIEAGSAECQTPPTPPTGTKLVKHYGTGETHSVECNSSSALTESEVTSGGVSSAITSAEIGSCVQAIGNGAFFRCYSLSRITIPDSVTSIGMNAFRRCSSLSSITIPNSVTSIGDSAFSNCSAMTTCNIPSGVTSIGNSTFIECSSLTSITIPDSVTSIGNGAFSNCRSLTSVTIPSGVTSIDDYAFADSIQLQSITIEATTPPGLEGVNVFSNSTCPIYVPASSVQTYKNRVRWSTYASRIQPIP